jgi:hypothetical protein
MNFTPDYISLCKNEKVQGLRPFMFGWEIVEKGIHKYVSYSSIEWFYIEDKIIGNGVCQIGAPQPYGSTALEYTDYYVYKHGVPISGSISKYSTTIWLPTSDQLDQYIIEQLDDGSDYTFIYTNFSKEAGHYNAIVYEGGEVKEQITGEINPLICKLKLLISLLEEEE